MRQYKKLLAWQVCSALMKSQQKCNLGAFIILRYDDRKKALSLYTVDKNYYVSSHLSSSANEITTVKLVLVLGNDNIIPT